MRYLFEEYAFDTDRRELHRGADVVSVAPQVFDLLDYLIRNRERVVSKDDLINAIWNGRIVSDAALTTRLNAARTAIGDSGEEQRLINPPTPFSNRRFQSSAILPPIAFNSPFGLGLIAMVLGGGFRSSSLGSPLGFFIWPSRHC